MQRLDEGLMFKFGFFRSRPALVLSSRRCCGLWFRRIFSHSGFLMGTTRDQVARHASDGLGIFGLQPAAGTMA